MKQILVPSPAEIKQLIPDNNILTGWRGSVAHGTYLDPDDPNSVDDKDLMGMCFAPVNHYLGLKSWGSSGTLEIKVGDWDVVHYEIRKMFSLLLRGNPNVVSLLWMTPEYYILTSPEGQRIIDNRHFFSSKKMWKAFEGYAWSQYERMKRGEFKGHCKEKRQALFDQFGYDCKAASHMIRLVRMARDFYVDGKLTVFRPDNRDLLSIKTGAYKLPEVENMFSLCIEAASEACKKSSLPEEPMYNEAEELLIDLLGLYIKRSLFFKQLQEELNK